MSAFASKSEVCEELDKVLNEETDNDEVTAADPSEWGTTPDAQAGMMAAMNMVPGL